VWGFLGFLTGFVGAGAAWVAAGLPFPISTRFPLGVVLLLVLPYGPVVEVAGYAIDAGRPARPVRLGLIGLGCGGATLVAEFAALRVVTPWEWASAAVWLALPVALAAVLVVAWRRPPGRNPTGRTDAGRGSIA